ncbi:hypothetical protein [Pseudomonas zeae]|uniref:Uncharacterized protein n=1 Tax=Pseudomonas zeae TaxID=2745510 RepID=A0A9E6TD02_9PSED|nr:hypothetical protein [Pseudomonas zeae]QXI13596.1 hypothetical protein HU754_009325 [Pseudomonas zeae]
MADQPYIKLQGMEVEFVSGVLEQRTADRAIGYSVTFKLMLDFTHFKQMANAYSANYLEVSSNAIRPELEGLAYHNHYSVIGASAGKIVNSAMLFELFTDPDLYLDVWINSEMERRFGKPQFVIEGNALLITARQDFRWQNPEREIKIEDLPIIWFDWALTLIEQRTKVSRTTPVSVVTFMYMQDEVVVIEGMKLLKGARYINGKRLSFGPITAEQVLIA